MVVPKIVMDTNVLISALRSRLGGSYQLLKMVGQNKFDIFISVPLILEYEAVSKRLIGQIELSSTDINNVLDYICKVAKHNRIYYLWRPFLPDAKDDMVLELAVSAACDFIITHNLKDFKNVHQFGLDALTPQQFLKRIGG